MYFRKIKIIKVNIATVKQEFAYICLPSISVGDWLTIQKTKQNSPTTLGSSWEMFSINSFKAFSGTLKSQIFPKRLKLMLNSINLFPILLISKLSWVVEKSFKCLAK